MSKRIRAVMPDGEFLYANYPVDSEHWTVEDGQDFFAGLMQKAFPCPPGTKQEFLMSVERRNDGLMIAISVDHRTLIVGPFETTTAGMDGLTAAAEFKAINRKDFPAH